MDKSIFIEFRKALERFGLEWFNRYYGVYSGTCIANDKDDKNLGRLKIKCPTVYSDYSPEYLAFPRSIPGAGKGHGIFWLPEAGDPIRVSFENGDPRFPLWEYGWYLKGNAPADTNPKKKSLVSTNGHRLDFDDENDVVTIKTSAGHTITMDDNGTLKIENKDGQIIDLQGSAIFLGNQTNNLKNWLADFNEAVQAITVATVYGSSPINNLATFVQLAIDLETFLTD